MWFLLHQCHNIFAVHTLAFAEHSRCWNLVVKVCKSQPSAAKDSVCWLLFISDNVSEREARSEHLKLLAVKAILIDTSFGRPVGSPEFVEKCTY